MSNTTTIRVSKQTYNEIKGIAKQQNENIQDIIEHAVDEYKKKRFFDEMNSAFMRLKSNPEDWKDETKERIEWDKVLSDGMEDEA